MNAAYADTKGAKVHDLRIYAKGHELAKGKDMRRKLIIDGNAVYEMDDECVHRKGIQQEPIQNRQRSVDQKITDTNGSKNAWDELDEKKCSGKVKKGRDIHIL